MSTICKKFGAAKKPQAGIFSNGILNSFLLGVGGHTISFSGVSYEPFVDSTHGIDSSRTNELDETSKRQYEIESEEILYLIRTKKKS